MRLVVNNGKNRRDNKSEIIAPACDGTGGMTAKRAEKIPPSAHLPGHFPKTVPSTFPV
jgi:hypothetical protein